jgi:hypothetical protein
VRHNAVPNARFHREISMRLRRCLLVTSLLPLFAGCSIPLVGHSGDKKSECDRMAAEAIQTQDLGKARELAAGASGCYAKLTQ